ncbi:Fe(3+)-hydroxamate ABC transporter permease FhuB [Pseudomonas sp. HLS-6]|uniref:Fe(3+)-hydroxamate ABC transporter permease FhuB n=1 Tax=Pseudomonas sp. HLS-6 TaxID=2049589 RepID=UPI000C1764B0|nr:Fe(3+)-hydroxamate ABC transporter permease FhuB [Pseudomonas sp. HLS-6]ATR83377.1 Fe(3+)-hydroxamate ABC transporter permease FhuB [Pseudomonas sp. HLS-6]
MILRYINRHPAPLLTLMLLAALALATGNLATHLPPGLWWQAVSAPQTEQLDQLLVHYSWLPRMAMAWLCGATLALTGCILQQALRNPLAEPATLGIASGAQLALSMATLWAPGLLVHGREWLALAGGAVALLLVFALAWRRAFSPLALILGGILVSLYFGAVNAGLMIIHGQELGPLFIWGAGSLVQQDWQQVAFLLPRLLPALGVLLLIRPLTLLGLEDSGARALGLSLNGSRVIALVLALWLSGCVVASVGMIGFIGLTAPSLCSMLGARRLKDRLLWSPVLGALLLWLTDLLVQSLEGFDSGFLPTGAATALAGAPLLIWLVQGLRLRGDTPHSSAHSSRPRYSNRVLLSGLALLLVATVMVALAVGDGPQGWTWSHGPMLQALLEWRTPRVFAALGCGALLALAGCLIQRLTGNPLASPELLGISSGAAMGMLLALIALPAASNGTLVGASTAGAVLTFAALLALSRRDNFSPTQLLLVGIAVGALFDALLQILLANGDSRAQHMLNWMAGSTYRANEQTAWLLGGMLMLFGGLCLMLHRWLDILPLGEAATRGFGVSLRGSRLALLGLSALMTACATVVIGPLSFIGLLAPHLTRMLGLVRARAQLMGAILLGALVMVAADWLGRNVLYPYQMPAGLLAALIAGPYLMLQLWRR